MKTKHLSILVKILSFSLYGMASFLYHTLEKSSIAFLFVAFFIMFGYFVQGVSKEIDEMSKGGL